MGNSLTEEEDQEERFVATTWDAVLAYGAFRLNAFAGNTVWHLRRLPAAGIWEDCAYGTVWDEFCHEAQEGPFDIEMGGGLPSLSDAFEMTITPIIDSLFDKLPREEEVLLTFFAIEDFGDFERYQVAGYIDRAAMRSKVFGFLRDLAGRRDLYALRPERDC